MQDMGLLDQLEESFYLGCKEEHSSIKILEVGEYSLFVKENLDKIKEVIINRRCHTKVFKSKEILPSPSGSIIYFDETVKKDFRKNCSYPTTQYKKIEISLKAFEEACNRAWVKPEMTKLINEFQKINNNEQSK